MTSNIGARDIKTSGSFGFGVDAPKDIYKTMKSTIEDAVKRVFNPEFLNRIDDTIVFHSLSREHIDKIIDIQMHELVKRMATLDISIHLSKQAREFLVDKGYDPAFGARPLKRALQKYIEDSIAEEILRNKFGQGSIIRVKLNPKTESLKFIEGNKSRKIKKAPEEKPSEANVT
jgi:ATP-dependent Clp protease ATP-binding subunit ClpC